MCLSLVNQAHGRRGGVLTSVTVLLAIIAAAWFLWVLEDGVEAADFTRVETADVRLDVGAGWSDPRWQALVAERVSHTAPFDCEDADAAAAIVSELRLLPFVLSVAPPEVLWPDGLRIQIEMRTPIACVKVGREFLGIANDGMLLPGAWPTPPAREQGFLPVISMDENAARNLRPGEVLWNDCVADALSVASSMWAELEGEDLARLGYSIIDARKARLTSVEEPGTILYLENSRRILFGRAPSTREPGELPVATKWLHVANALLCLPEGPAAGSESSSPSQPDAVDWELVEVRWDHAAILPRGGKPDARLPVKSVKTQKLKSPSTNAPASPKLGRVH